MKKVYIETNGCAVLRNETYRIAKFFDANGYEEVGAPQLADAVVFTACGVTQDTEDQALMALKMLNDLTPEGAPLIVSGCLPNIHREAILGISPRALIWSYEELEQLDEFFDAKVSFSSCVYNVNPTRHHSHGDPLAIKDEGVRQDEQLAAIMKKEYGNDIVGCKFRYSTKGKHLWKEEGLYEIRVAYGCACKCSYCATKLGIGNFRSVPLDWILKQYKEGVDAGYKRFMLMGDEIGYYGSDIQAKDGTEGIGECVCEKGAVNIITLVKALYQIAPQVKIGIRYIDPGILVKYYEEFRPFFENGFVEYFCSAFQSGSPEVLKRMNRNPDVQPFLDCMHDMEVRRYPVIKHTQVIVGFPGETEADFRKTVEAFVYGGFDYAAITCFSPRKGTPAYDFADRISEDVMEERSRYFNMVAALNRKSRIYDAVKEVVNQAIPQEEVFKELAEELKTYIGDKGALVYYGSPHKYFNKDTDVDVCVFVPELSEDDKVQIGAVVERFHREKGLKLDLDMPYISKTAFSLEDLGALMQSAPFPVKDGVLEFTPVTMTREFLDSDKMRQRLLLNILTVPGVFIGGDLNFYQCLVSRGYDVLWKYLLMSDKNATELSLEELYERLTVPAQGAKYYKEFLGYDNDSPEQKEYLLAGLAKAKKRWLAAKTL